LKRTFSAWRFGDKVPGLTPWAVFRRGFAAETLPACAYPGGSGLPAKTFAPDFQ